MNDDRYKHVLVPTNFTPECRAAYRTAFAAARASGATVTLFHVLPPPTSEFAGNGLDAFRMLHRAAERKSAYEQSTPEQAAAERSRAVSKLQNEISKEWSDSVEVRFEVGRGNAISEIARFIRSSNADVIVVGGSRPGRLPSLVRCFADRLALATPVKIVRVVPSLL